MRMYATKKYATAEQKQYIKDMMQQLGLEPINEIEFSAMTGFRATQETTKYQRMIRNGCIDGRESK